MKITNCKKCNLWKSRKHIVKGQGNKKAKIVFVGEAPGKEEDIQGLPFVGAAGKKLDWVLGEFGLKREEVFVTNVTKCLPLDSQGNVRTPNATEIKACQDYLFYELKELKPKWVIALGAVALKVLTGEEGINQWRGKQVSENVLALAHPAYLLYSPGDKQRYKYDIQNLVNIIRRNNDS